MSAKTKEVGGGPATGLADQFVSWLSQGLNTGMFGPGAPAGGDAFGATRGVGSYLTDVLSGGAGTLGGNLATMIGKETDRNAAALRARFGVGGGSAFGTPAAYAESLFRSESAPKLATAVGGLQQNALRMLLPLFANIAQKGITQRQTVTEQNPWVTAAGVAAPIAAAALNFAAPGAGSAVSGLMAGVQAGNRMAAPAQSSILSNIYSGGFGQNYELPPVATLPWAA